MDPDPNSEYGSGSTHVNRYRFRITVRQNV